MENKEDISAPIYFKKDFNTKEIVLDKNGKVSYEGKITINEVEYKVSMYSPRDSASSVQFNLYLKPKGEYKEKSYNKASVSPQDFEKGQINEDVFKDFGSSVEISDDDIAF